MSEFPNNSLKYRSSLDGPSQEKKEEKKPKKERLQKVIDGEAKRTKKSFTRRLIDSFIKDDIPGIKKKLIEDVIIPNITDGLFNITNNAVAMIFGRPVRPAGRTNYSTATRASYTPYYEKDRSQEMRKAAYAVDDITFQTRGEADRVLEAMMDAIDRYGILAVADYYDIAGITPEPSDFKIGWDNIDGARTAGTSNGYIIRLPRARQID